MRRYYPISIMLLVFLVVSVGCSQGGGEKALKERVSQAWEARMSGDSETLYDLATNEYKEKVPRDSFTYETNINLTGFIIEKIEIAEGGTRAIASVKIKVEQKGFTFAFPINEEWLYEEGTWRLALKTAPKGTFHPDIAETRQK